MSWMEVTRDYRVLVDMSRPGEYGPSLAASKAVFRNLASEQGLLHLAATIEALVWHSCRVTFATMGAVDGASVQEILSQMRSVTPEMAQTYQRATGALTARLTKRVQAGALVTHVKNKKSKRTQAASSSATKTSPAKNCFDNLMNSAPAPKSTSRSTRRWGSRPGAELAL